MRRGRIVRQTGVTLRTGVGDCAIALAITALGVGIVIGAHAMPLGSLSMPGPGFFPMALGLVLVASALLVFARALQSLRSSSATEELFQGQVVVALSTLVWVGFTFERLGAEVAFAGFLLVWLRAYARLRWPVVIVTAITVSFVVCRIFRDVLGVNLPRGLLGPG